ncbi:triose-phosphate transporter family-domain-containing protein [Globomyces pollinis-pini]|nr:triose-phosphate transporter family-domain-containing protein [Globomyces pollinis-pini]
MSGDLSPKKTRVFRAGNEKPKVTWVIFLVLSWYTTSISLHLYNKWLFSKEHNDFHFPLFTTMIHMTMQFILSYGSLQFILPKLKPTRYPTKFDYFFKVVPCGLATGLDIGLSNSSLKYVSLSFYTMVKSAAPVFILLFAYLFGLEKPSLSLTGAIGLICFGVGFMVANDTTFNAFGYFQVQSATILSGLRWSLTQVLLESEKMGMNNPLATNLFLAPIVCVSLLFSFLSIEGTSDLLASPRMHDMASSLWLLLTISLGGCIAFLMVNIEFMLISTTSVVTFSITGIFKEIITITAAILVFGDEFTPNMIYGLLISLVGIGAFNYIRIQQMNQRAVEYEELDPSGFELENFPESEDWEHLN